MSGARAFALAFACTLALAALATLVGRNEPERPTRRLARVRVKPAATGATPARPARPSRPRTAPLAAGMTTSPVVDPDEMTDAERAAAEAAEEESLARIEELAREANAEALLDAF